MIQRRLAVITEMTIDAAELVMEAVRLPRTRIIIIVHHDDPEQPDGGYVALGARGYPADPDHPELGLAGIANDAINAIQTTAETHGLDLRLVELMTTRKGQG